ncbi:uncharacterized protein LOC121875962 [Homarus americanus]|uniref:uncharacterized protein LOC121875962 n=1 Tax=Homarus americanus TaxID=6706 RepID=UPI001C44CD92|nr:uncharacterized protein LOC121875962 [Homarus americanus]
MATEMATGLTAMAMEMVMVTLMVMVTVLLTETDTPMETVTELSTATVLLMVTDIPMEMVMVLVNGNGALNGNGYANGNGNGFVNGNGGVNGNGYYNGIVDPISALADAIGEWRRPGVDYPSWLLSPSLDSPAADPCGYYADCRRASCQVSLILPRGRLSAESHTAPRPAVLQVLYCPRGQLSRVGLALAPETGCRVESYTAPGPAVK